MFILLKDLFSSNIHVLKMTFNIFREIYFRINGEMIVKKTLAKVLDYMDTYFYYICQYELIS